MFVGGVVVSDDVERFVLGSLPVNEAEKRNPVLVGMAVAALAEHATVECVQSGEQCGCSVSLVVMRLGFPPAFFHRQTGLRTVQRLNLTFLVYRKHDGVLW